MKITVNKSENKVSIKEIRIDEPTVQHIIDAARISGANEGMEFMAALISQICTFDGQAMPYEDLTKLPAKIFLELSGALITSGVLPSEEGPSTLSGKAASATKA